ncbi:MAG: hypothetical protein GX842_01865 [Spirochaetales bacterium]|nr:hypothetical protein [Spirochaetales bacterium]
MKRALKVILIVLAAVVLLIVAGVVTANLLIPPKIVASLGDEISVERLSLALQRGEIRAQGVNYKDGEVSAESLSLQISLKEVFAWAFKKRPLKTFTIEGENLITPLLGAGEVNLILEGEIDPFNLDSAVIKTIKAHLRSLGLPLMEIFAVDIDETIFRGRGALTLASLQKEAMEILLDFDEIELVTRDLKLQPLFPLAPFALISPWVVDPDNWEMNYLEFYFNPAEASLIALDSHILMGRGSVDLPLTHNDQIAIRFEVGRLNEQVRSELTPFFFFLGLEIPEGEFVISLEWRPGEFPAIEFY